MVAFAGDYLLPLGHATALCHVKVVLIKISLRQRGASAAICRNTDED